MIQKMRITNAMLVEDLLRVRTASSSISRPISGQRRPIIGASADWSACTHRIRRLPPPPHESGRFVEVETPDGKGLRFGEWVERKDGLWALIIPLNNAPMLHR